MNAQLPYVQFQSESSIVADSDDDTTNILQSSHSLIFNAFLMILLTEIGDKTFFITAILAMKHPRPIIVWIGAISSLTITSFLAAQLGSWLVLTRLVSGYWMTVGIAVLFFGFGGKMVWEGATAADTGESGGGEEMREARRQIELDDDFEKSSSTTTTTSANRIHCMENGKIDQHHDYPHDSTTSKRSSSSRFPPVPPLAVYYSKMEEGFRNLCNLLFGPVFVQAFILAFISEMGDRSQVATLALGAAHDVYLVTFGIMLGHCVCTTMAVFGGRLIADKISIKHVTIGGGILFLIFGVVYTYEAISTFSMS